MNKEERKQAERDFENFLIDLRSKGFDILVFNRIFIWERHKIIEHCGKDIYSKTLKVLNKANSPVLHRKFLFIFEKDEKRDCWLSLDYPDRIVINFACGAPTLENILGVEEERRQIEEGLAELKSSKV